jgi:Bacterial Ig-like domain (group 2)
MKVRLYLTTVFACLAIATGWAAGCGKSSPTSPTVGPPTVTAVTVTGNAALTAPGQTSQLTLEATLSDGSKKDVTSTALWSSSNRNVMTITAAGLAMAVDFGQASVQGSSMAAAKSSPNFVMTVLPAGTYILSGRVTEGGDFPVADVRVETIGGLMTGRAVMTNGSGRYAFNACAASCKSGRRRTDTSQRPRPSHKTPSTSMSG